MSGRIPKDRKEEEDLNGPDLDRTPESFSRDWEWLDALKSVEFDSDFVKAVEERVEDQKRPLLEDLFG